MKTNIEKFDEGYLELCTLFDGMGDKITLEEMNQKIIDFGKECGLDMSVSELTNEEKEERLQNLLAYEADNTANTEMFFG